MQTLHFLHIGKTGGSAIKFALSAGNLETADRKIILHRHLTRLPQIPRGEAVFFFVRDPVSRFLSGFYSRQRQGLPRYFNPWSTEERGAFAAFSRPEELALALTAADDQHCLAARDAMNSIRHVRDSYWNWFGNEKYLEERSADIIFVGRQESLSADFERLKRLLHLDPGLLLPQDDVIGHRNPASCDYRLSDTAVANLKQWYERDYLFLHLCNQLPASRQEPPG